MRDSVRRASAQLREAGVGSPEADALLLLAHAVGVDPAEVRRRMILRAELTPAQADTFEALVSERCRRVPLQHLTGTAYFRGLELAVGPGVFIPRPETELTVELALRAVRSASLPNPVVVDLCSGSGAIALAVKDEAPEAEVHAVELSDAAGAWAQRNRQALGLDVQIVTGDATTALAELDGLVDVVVANPPYIPLHAVPHDPEVREHDPELALYGGSEDGLAIPLAVAARAAVLLRGGSALVLEHADVQGGALVSALERSGLWRDVEDHHDLNDLPRVLTATRRH